VAPRQRRRFLPELGAGRPGTRLALATLGAFLLALGLSGPVRGYTVREVKRRGLDLVVCIDVSRSMLVRDLRPDRMSRAKREVSGLLDHLRGDRVALLAFAGDVREIAPLTHDRTTLEALIAEVRPGENAVGGTNIGAALERALALFDGRTGAHEAIVLLTDGEDLEGRGQAVARQAAERGIKIFVVGLGSPAGGKIPTRGADGAEAFVSDEEGAEVVSSLDDATLREIAELSGGDYLPAQASPTPLEDLYEHRVLRLEGRDIGGGQEWLPHDRFQWFGVLALGCILFESALRERRRLRGARRVASVLLGALALGAGPAQAQEQAQGATQVVAPWVGTPRAALLELQERCAKTEYEQALSVGAALLARSDLAEPERAEVHFNLGVAREAAGDRAGAQAEFERAATLAGPGKLRLDALYDAGTLALLAAEELRLEIPEVREKLGLPAPAAAAPGLPPPAGAPVDEQAPDTLSEAKAAYGHARDALVRRLRADWRDENTRANLELVQRRLRELAEIEEQREQEEQQQDQEQQPSEDQQGEQPDKEQQGEEQPQDQKPDEQPQDQPPDQPSDEQKPEEQQEEQPPEPGEDQAEPPQPEQPGEEPSEERVLSREEMQRLLDRLQEIEQEARELAARLRAQRRVPVRKDW
jgi:Ca-activated chloride channel family protein